MNRLAAACTVIVGASLYFLYGTFVLAFVFRVDVSQLDPIQLTIILTQVVRLVGVLAAFGLRRPRWEVVLVLFSLETFVVLGLIGVYLVVPDPLFSSLGHEIFSTWMASLLTILTPYPILASGAEMLRSRNLTWVLLSVVTEFSFLTFLSGILSQYKGPFTFGDFFDFLILATKTDMASGAAPQLSAPALVVPAVAIYAALLVYCTIPKEDARTYPNTSFGLPLLSALGALAWVWVAAKFLPDTLLSFTGASVIIVALLWSVMRK
jgi:hypothetical protein